MATAFRSSQTVTNGTAGTTVVVSKPASIVDTGSNPGRDHLIAYIAAAGAPTITPPAGWTLITSLADASNVTLWVYRKLASAEGASWTWTFGSSVRNWGWVGAYTGVDPTSPVTATGTDSTLTGSTALTTSPVSLLADGQGVAAAAAVRTASGAATTWTHTSTERADLSTNAGAGIDIAGVVGDSVNSSGTDGQYIPTMTASQAQTSGVAISVTLNPYFVPFDGARLTMIVEAALGTDPDNDDLSTVTWTDITSSVLYKSKVTLRFGRPNATSLADPAMIRLALKNLNGEWTHPNGTYYPFLRRNLPIRVGIKGFGTSLTRTHHRGTAFLSSARLRWDTSLKVSFIDVECNGRLRRMQRNTLPLHSAAYRTISNSPTLAIRPWAYWSFEDGSDSTSAKAAVPGVPDAAVFDFDFSASSAFLGSDSLPVLSATSTMYAQFPDPGIRSQWTLVWSGMMPTEPAAATTVLRVTTTGGAASWKVSIVPGTSALQLDVTSGSGASLLSTSVTLNEAGFYGQPVQYVLSARENNTGIDYAFATAQTVGGGGGSGTIASVAFGQVREAWIDAQAGLAGFVFGHLAEWVDSTSNDAVGDAAFLSLDVFNAAVLAHVGEVPSARFQRLCIEENVPYAFESSENGDLTMGPQGITDFVTLLRECEAVEQNILHDAGTTGTGATGALMFPARDSRDNSDVVMTLDFDAGSVASGADGGFEPTLDDQSIANSVEVSRFGGSTAVVTDNVSIKNEGRYRASLTPNVEDDTFLDDIAGNQVALGTLSGLRYPVLGWNLFRTPALAEQWLACQLSSKIRVTNLPSQYPPDDLSLLIEGYTEVLSQTDWAVAANITSDEANRIFVLSSDTADAGTFVGRLAGDPDAAIRTAISSGATSIDFDPNFYRWTTVADDFSPNLTVRFGGETAAISNISTTAGTFVAVGAASHSDNAAVTPALYAGGQALDLIVLFAVARGSATFAAPPGYTLSNVFDVGDSLAVFLKVHTGSESNPTVTPTGGSSGDTVSAFTFGLRGTPSTLDDLVDVVRYRAAQSNSSTQNIDFAGVYPFYDAGTIVVLLAWKGDDYTSVAVPTGFTEMIEASTTVGNDQSLYAAYQIQTTPALAGPGTLVVTGGAAANSKAVLVAFAAGYQTLTVGARSSNGVVKAHNAATKIEVELPCVLGM